MSGDNGLTAEDAVKALNTEIMAGKGPDVLCLDGLPLDSYLSKGMLADLSDTLKAAEEKEEFFNNITRAFEKDGKIYAIPTRFRTPFLWENRKPWRESRICNPSQVPVKNSGRKPGWFHSVRLSA